MQKPDSIRINDSVSSCYVINYSHFKKYLKIRRMLLDGQMTYYQVPAADLLRSMCIHCVYIQVVLQIVSINILRKTV